MKLIYFTASYPYGLGEQWKTNELNALVQHFDEITVIPYSYGGNFDKPKAVPAGIRVVPPLFRQEGNILRKTDILRILFHRKAPLFLREFFRKKVYRNKPHLISWMNATMNGIRLLRHPAIREVLRSADKKTALYFFWGRGSCDFVPFIDTGRFCSVFVRMHRFDLFEDVNNGYIPYRRALLQKISVAAPTSDVGKRHLLPLYPEFAGKIRVVHLGNLWNGKRTRASGDGILRVVSCSFLSPVKRVSLMIESLQHIHFPIVWRHVGDGTLRQELEELIEKKSLQDKFFIEGMIDASQVLDYYDRHTFDIFVNVSSSEGIPLSIVEAFSLGIPALATDVGGNGEIVDDKVGKLLPADPTPEEIAEGLTAFYKLSAEKKNELRENAHARSIAGWDVIRISADVATSLKNCNNC